ncbi:MAG: ABC transporter permease [Spirochaetales bacterium]
MSETATLTRPQSLTTERRFGGEQVGLIAILVLLVVALATLQPVFLSGRNLMNILLSASMNGIVAAGVTYVILSGGLDLSVGSVVALSGTCVAMLSNAGLPPSIAIIATLLIGIFVGFVNAVFITAIGVNPLITTLGTMMAYRGLAFIISDGSAVYIGNSSLYWVGVGRVFGIPVPVIVLALVFFVFWLILSKTVFGRNLYVIGGNREAARLSGVNISIYSYIIYIISAAMAALSGIILAGRMTSGQPTAADGLELDVVTAVVLGGAALSGGVGTMVGTILGVLILTVFRNGLLLLNVDAFYQYVASGLLLLTAVTIDQLRSRRKRKSKAHPQK